MLSRVRGQSARRSLSDKVHLLQYKVREAIAEKMGKLPVIGSHSELRCQSSGYTQLLTGFRQTMPFQKARQLWYSTSALQNSQSDTNLSQMSPANKVDTKLLNPDEPLASKNQVTQSNDGTSQQGNIPQNLFDINETRDPSGNSLEGAEDSDVNALQKSMGKPKSQGHIKYLKTRNRKQMNHIPEENREHDSRKHIPGGIAGPDRNHNIQNQDFRSLSAKDPKLIGNDELPLLGISDLSRLGGSRQSQARGSRTKTELDWFGGDKESKLKAPKLSEPWPEIQADQLPVPQTVVFQGKEIEAALLWLCVHQEKEGEKAKLYRTTAPLNDDIFSILPEGTLQVQAAMEGLSFTEHHDERDGDWYNFKIGMWGDVAKEAHQVFWPNGLIHPKSERRRLYLRNTEDVLVFLADPVKERMEEHKQNLDRIQQLEGYSADFTYKALVNCWGKDAVEKFGFGRLVPVTLEEQSEETEEFA